jgi:hypothetical protein
MQSAKSAVHSNTVSILDRIVDPAVVTDGGDELTLLPSNDPPKAMPTDTSASIGETTKSLLWDLIADVDEGSLYNNR